MYILKNLGMHLHVLSIHKFEWCFSQISQFIHIILQFLFKILLCVLWMTSKWSENVMSKQQFDYENYCSI